jgi:hypothetical protein
MEYLDGARRLGDLIRTFRSNAGTYPGFLGGIDDPEGPAPVYVGWSSTEHNLDVVAAFTVMFERTGETLWQDDAQHARAFVETMWETARGCYLAGTLDPDTRNDLPGQLPVDTHSWSALATADALTLHPDLLQCPETFHRLTHHTFDGFDFNDDRDGVWLEGTAQMALAYSAARQPGRSLELRGELERAQTTAPWGDGQGLAAACHDGLSTGFGFSFFRRLHLAATAWHLFAQQRFNPYYAEVLGRLFDDGFESGDIGSWSAGVP